MTNIIHGQPQKEGIMTVTTEKFARKPFYVDTVQVTEENINDVAAWCEGEVRTFADGNKYVKVHVHRPLNDRQTMASIGDWVLFAGSGFKVYTTKAFFASFEPICVECDSTTKLLTDIFSEPVFGSQQDIFVEPLADEKNSTPILVQLTSGQDLQELLTVTAPVVKRSHRKII